VRRAATIDKGEKTPTEISWGGMRPTEVHPGHYILSVTPSGYLLCRVADDDLVYTDNESETRLALDGLHAFCETLSAVSESHSDRNIARAMEETDREDDA
jgi:hypothetical protein